MLAADTLIRSLDPSEVRRVEAAMDRPSRRLPASAISGLSRWSHGAGKRYDKLRV